jgi:RHS repeat-associated protein
VVQEQTGGVPSANLLTGLAIDEIWARTDGQGTRTLLLDALRSTIGETDPSGATQTNYSYEPFGVTRTTGAPSSNLFQYTGRETSGATSDVFYYRARYYNAALGRFLSEDQAAFGDGRNLYTYADNNPILLVDPMGLQSVPGRQPDGSYAANLSDPRLDPLTRAPYPSAPRPYGESSQCVSFTKMFTGAPCTDCWRAGPKVLGDTDIPLGTAIATFDDNGRYPGSATTAKNSGIYIGQRDGRVFIIDQWPGHNARARTIDPGGSPSNDSNAYSVVLVPPGTKSSKCKCL